jgi:hypothetical protein
MRKDLINNQQYCQEDLRDTSFLGWSRNPIRHISFLHGGELFLGSADRLLLIHYGAYI